MKLKKKFHLDNENKQERDKIIFAISCLCECMEPHAKQIAKKVQELELELKLKK